MITIEEKQIGNTLRISFSGHAGYAKPGKDIVCSAVSALFYTLLHGVNELCPGAVHADGEALTLTRSTPEISGAITAVLAGLRAIEQEYPKCVRIEGACEAFYSANSASSDFREKPACAVAGREEVTGEHAPPGCERQGPTST